MTMTFEPKPIYPFEPILLTNVLLADVYRQIWKDYAERLFAKSFGIDERDPIEVITWGKALGDASSAAQALRSFVPNSHSTRIVGMLGASNYLYHAYMVGAWLNDWTIIFLSERNSVAGQESLLRAVGASALVFDEKNEGIAHQVKTQLDHLIMMEIQDLDHIPQSLDALNLPLRNPTVEELQQIVAYTHTSGTTGHPKPVPITHSHFVADIETRSAAQYAGTSVFSPVPIFHSMGLFVFTRWSIGSGVVPTFISSKQPFNGSALLRYIKRLPNAICFLPPIILEQAVRESPMEFTILRTCKRVLFGGAPIDPSIAEILIKNGVPLVSGFGSAECSLLAVPDFPSDNRINDWPYIRFIEGQYELSFKAIQNSRLFELIVSPGPKKWPCVINWKDPIGYNSNDLWEPHPIKPDLWKPAGRKDNVTVLSNGEKTDNAQIVGLIMKNPHVSAAVVFGAGKSLNGILIFPGKRYGAVGQEFLDQIWNTVEEANRIIPAHSKIIRQMILISEADKPFVATDKGTIRTKQTLDLYSKEIEAAYEALENGPEFNVTEIKDEVDILGFVRKAVQSVVGRLSIKDDDDLFRSGLDSLGALQLHTKLISVIPTTKDFPHDLIYSRPYIAGLVEWIVAIREGKPTSMQSAQEKINLVDQYITKHSSGFTRHCSSGEHINDTSSQTQSYSILLTGGTGSLGSHLLHGLLKRNDIERVFCLHRGSAGLEQHFSTFEARGISKEGLVTAQRNLRCISVDLSIPTLGLSSDILEELLESVTHILHVAWELNFNWKLEHFEYTHISGVRHLIDLALSSRRVLVPRFIFISSIGAVERYKGSMKVPEDPVYDPSVTGSSGYGQAKYISERIIELASHAGLRATIIRAAQLSGSTLDGFWSPSEFIPMLLTTSMHLGKIPEEMPDTRWLPVDIAAKCVLKISLIKNAPTLAVYHLENPTSTPWVDIIRMYTKIMGGQVKSIPSNEWLSLLGKIATNTSTSSNIALQLLRAAALLEFYSDLVSVCRKGAWITLDVTKAQLICPEIDHGSIAEELLKKYIDRLRSPDTPVITRFQVSK